MELQECSSSLRLVPGPSSNHLQSSSPTVCEAGVGRLHEAVCASSTFHRYSIPHRRDIAESHRPHVTHVCGLAVDQLRKPVPWPLAQVYFPPHLQAVPTLGSSRKDPGCASSQLQPRPLAAVHAALTSTEIPAVPQPWALGTWLWGSSGSRGRNL